MVKIRQVLLMLAMMFISLPIYSQEEAFDWTDVIEAIITIESNGNPNARNGNSLGVMQITPILVKECNNINRRRKIPLRYTLNDRRSVEKSKEMFILIQSEFNKNNDVEFAIKSWNGGVYFKPTKKINIYYKKVLKELDNIHQKRSQKNDSFFIARDTYEIATRRPTPKGVG